MRPETNALAGSERELEEQRGLIISEVQIILAGSNLILLNRDGLGL